MPRYEYQCDNGHRYERSEGFDAPSEQKCERCGGPSRRLISLPAVIFKGTGFYSTDNRKPSSTSGDGGSSSGDGASSDGGSSSASSDSGDTAASGGESKAEEAKKTD